MTKTNQGTSVLSQTNSATAFVNQPTLTDVMEAIDLLKESIEELTEKVNNISLDYGTGFSISEE